MKHKFDLHNLYFWGPLFLIFSVSLIRTDFFIYQSITSQFLYFSFIVPVIICCYWVSSKEKQIRLNCIDFFLLLFYFYNFGNILVNRLVIVNEQFIHLTLLTALYFLNKIRLQSDKNLIRYELQIITFVSYIHVIIGLLQVVYTHTSQVISTFDHTTTFSNYLASVFPLILGANTNYKSYFKKVMCFILLLFTLVLIIFLEERTIIISCILAFFVFIYFKYKQRMPQLNTYLKNNKLTGAIALFTVIFLGYTLFVFLLGYRPLSFLGRVFIWEISINAIKENPVFGYGFDSFQAIHNKFQVIYFAKNSDVDSYKFLVADNIKFAFNEFIQFFLELGIIGLLLFILFVSTVVRTGFKSLKGAAGKDKTILLMVLTGFISILVCSLSSYPLRRLPVMLNFFLFASIISSYESKVILINPGHFRILPRTILFVLVISIIFITGKRAVAYHGWKTGYDLIRKGETGDGLAIYEKCYRNLKHNKYFLYNYGVELAQDCEFEKSIRILNIAKEELYDADVFLQLGNVYQKQANFGQAEFCYIQAKYLKPHLFEPRYRLFKLYTEKAGKHNEALKIALEIINLPVKVNSEIIQNIKTETKTYLHINHVNTNN